MNRRAAGSRWWLAAVGAMLGSSGCASALYANALSPVPVMLGPVDRIGGKSAPSTGETTIDAVMYDERGWGKSMDLGALNNAVGARLAAERLDAQRATVRIDEIATGDYMMWSIPYLTPILLIRHSRVNPQGRLQRESAAVSP